MLNKLKQKIRVRLNGLLRNGLHSDSYWYESPNMWEPTVVLALRDLVKSGSTVFDVGGNMGGITSVMSRLVGPKGVVCTFEASPRIIGYLQNNVVRQGHQNVAVYHRAIFSSSNETILIYDGNGLNDSIYSDNENASGHPVKTLALDDFSAVTGLKPDLIKIDIEGAEFDALNGAVGIIKTLHPHLILEQTPSDMRCFDLLTGFGYVAVDLSSYKQISSPLDFPEGATIRNILFVHTDRLRELLYQMPIPVTVIQKLDHQDFSQNANNHYSSVVLDLGPGRYILDVDFTATGTTNSFVCGIKGENGRDIVRLSAYSKLIADTYRDWVLDLIKPEKVYIYFEFLDGSSDPSFSINDVHITIKQLDNFSSRIHSYLLLD